LIRGAIDARLHPEWPVRLRRDPNLVQHVAPAATLAAVVAAGGLVMAMGVWHSPSRAGTAAATLTGLGLLAAIWRLRRRPRGPRRSDDDPPGGAGTPARPRPSAPPVLTAAGAGPSPGSGRRSDPE